MNANHRTILVVDDDEITTEQFARMLRLEGCLVCTALDAESALCEAKLVCPDAIVVDLRMPVTDGLGFLRQLRAVDTLRRTPVAVVTGDYFIDDWTRAELEALGARLQFKPMWLEDLWALVSRMLTQPVVPQLLEDRSLQTRATA